MTAKDVSDFVRKAEAVYANRLRAELEPDHMDEFVAIEPETGDHFLGRTLSEASAAARKCHPDRLTHMIRIGHSSAVHFGMYLG